MPSGPERQERGVGLARAKQMGREMKIRPTRREVSLSFSFLFSFPLDFIIWIQTFVMSFSIHFKY
jgi:hypothetical protein